MKKIILLFIVFISFSCKEDETVAQVSSLFQGDWSIPRDEVKSGGPGVDGIPALENPNRVDASEANYLEDDDLVIGFKVGNDARAYPHKILDWHEIVNDNLQSTPVAITYCPLTGTGIAWDATVNGEPTTFGVSGLLYNSNLIPYDRNSESSWSQMLLESVNGELINQEIKTFPLIETTWGTWKEMYPETTVISTNTGHARTYGSFPYLINGRDYRTDSFLLFPVNNTDLSLENKERVLGILLESGNKAYRFNKFGGGTTVLNEDNGLVVVGNQEKNFLVAYSSKLDDGTVLTFSEINDKGAVVMQDNEGNEWNVFGEAVSGRRSGQKLAPTKSYIGYWFAWAAFYPGIAVEG